MHHVSYQGDEGIDKNATYKELTTIKIPHRASITTLKNQIELHVPRTPRCALKINNI